MSVVRQQSLQVFADYHQFYVQDGGINPPAPEDWTDEDIGNRCKVVENVVVVCPLRSMTVPIEVVLHDSEPPLDSNGPDHVVECSLTLPTGHLQVHECTGGPVLNWELASGTYCVRLSYSGLNDRAPSRGVTPQPGQAEMHAVLSAALQVAEPGQYR